MPRKPDPREVRPRKLIALGAAAATTLVAPAFAENLATPDPAQGSYLFAQAEGEGGTGAAEAEGEGTAAEAEGEGTAAEAEGEGEGEGEGGGGVDPDVALIRGLGFMTGHLRAGMALYETGDLVAAKTHMGHPIEEKYDAVAEPLKALGHADLRDRLTALVDAAESEAPARDVRDRFEMILAGVAEVRAAAAISVRDQVLGLSELMRVAGDEYAVATEGGEVSNPHEYQDSWGFLQSIRSESEQFAASEEPAVAETGAEIVAIIDETLGIAYGDIQGRDIPQVDPSALYAGAARIELAGLGLD